MADFSNGTVDVTSTATLIVSVSPGTTPIVVANRGPEVVYLGSSSVTADTASTGGLPVNPGEKVNAPDTQLNVPQWDLYGITAGGDAYVSWLTS